jgi:hypothetical protein
MTVQINGMTFEFKQGQKVECASWLHIVTAISGNIEVLERILLSENIKAITSEIEDINRVAS